MSDEHRFERDARAWLELGPTDAPDRVVEAALLEIDQTSQERVLLIPWRLPTMTPRLGLAATALVAVVGLGLIYLNLPGRADVGAPSPTPTLTSPTSTPGTTTLDYSTIPGWIVFEHFGQAPDGSTTTFDFDRRQIWLVHADGTGLHELAPGNPVGKTSPDISPDGATVVFASWEPLSRLYQAPIDGGDPTLIDIDIECVVTAGVECKQDDPAYSPAGERIAFVRTVYSATTVSSQIGIHDLRSGQTSLIESTLVTDGILGQPTWSPDGLQLAYHHDTLPDLEEPPTAIRVNVVNVDGTGLHELPAPDGEAKAGDPDWSPDGSLIVFSTMPNREGEGDGNGRPGVYTIHPDGTGLTDICGACLGGGIAPSWTTDGKHILFWGYRTWALMDPDGRNMAHINSSKLTWFGDQLGYGYFALLQPTP
jgi:Tol biopolymer transport system component